MKRIIEKRVVPEDLSGLRTDKAAAELFTDFSRSELSHWLKEGFLLVDGGLQKAKEKISGGELMTLQIDATEKELWHAPQDIPLDILEEDDHILVINKSAGLVMHPGAGNGQDTLLTA